MEIHYTTCTCRGKHLSSILHASMFKLQCQKWHHCTLTSNISVTGGSLNTIEKVSIVTETNISYLTEMQENGYNFPAPELWIAACFYHPLLVWLVQGCPWYTCSAQCCHEQNQPCWNPAAIKYMYSNKNKEQKLMSHGHCVKTESLKKHRVTEHGWFHMSS